MGYIYIILWYIPSQQYDLVEVEQVEAGFDGRKLGVPQSDVLQMDAFMGSKC